jgi:hypothetical protein
MDIAIGILIAVVFWIWGVATGWQAREKHAERKLNHLLSQVDETVEENQIHITIEKHNGVFYVYDRVNNQFMAQANSVKELEEELQHRYPGKKFACPEKNMIEVGLIS